ncbi:hypothetical protein Daus18300_012462 [Diaporthe australafricana]|uniref:C6 finger domain-containing protein n=1 Tax=Diaporthe australafricana TaxID=127596 RepID=A0ABR3W2V5_9PEZI
MVRGLSDIPVFSGGTESNGYSFDAFPQHLSADNSSGETSSSSATMSNSPQQAIVPRGPLPISHLDALTRAPSKKKNERRGHFKSRNGCFNCKKRRIKYEFLMHSILGLAASELIASDPSLAEAAMVHRLKSIQAIKRKLASSDQGITYAEGNALIATCFALTFQSVILEDGMTEYMAFIRGLIVIVIQMWKAGVDFMFKRLLNQEQGDLLKPHIDKVTLPEGMWEWKAGALASLDGLRSLCAGDDLKLKYLQMTEDMANGLDEKSPYKGIAIKQIMAVITEVEKSWSPQKQNEKNNMDEGMGRWLRYLNRQVEPGLTRYNEWPVWVQAQLERDPCFFGKADGGGKPIERSCVGYAKLIT